MKARFQSLVQGAVLAVIVGWVLCIGKAVGAPVFFGVFLVHVIVGATHAHARAPLLGASCRF